MIVFCPECEKEVECSKAVIHDMLDLNGVLVLVGDICVYNCENGHSFDALEVQDDYLARAYWKYEVITGEPFREDR